MSNSSISQLQFRPLQQSNNGAYSCRTTTNESTLLSPAIEVHAEGTFPSTIISIISDFKFYTFSAPTVSIQINESTDGIAGENLELTCEVFGVENLNPTITYRWTKKDTSGDQMKAGTDSSILSFTTIRLSDAANYSCTAEITSNYLTGSITAVAYHSYSVTVQSKL
jgi:hypothetical protein